MFNRSSVIQALIIIFNMNMNELHLVEMFKNIVSGHKTED